MISLSQLWQTAVIGLLLCLGPVPQTRAQAEGPAAYRMGETIRVTPNDLPAPFATPSASNAPRVVTRTADARLIAPQGFRAALYAEGLRNPRMILPLPDGSLLISETRSGWITRVHDRNGDGQADATERFLDGLERPHGLALHNGYLYIGEAGQVRRQRLDPTRYTPQGSLEEVTAKGSLGGGASHVTRTILFAPDGRSFLVTVGSQGNVGEEPAPYATIQRFDANGKGQRSYATGLRNAIGIRRHPTTGEVWTVVNERDGLGDGLVPDYLTKVSDGDFFGWPWAYIGAHPDPRFGGRNPEPGRTARIPDLLFESHTAPIDFLFYDGTQFPAHYRGGAFVTLRGSWNAARPRGYAVAYIPFRNGAPLGHYEIFASGFRVDSGTTTRAEVWGRPAGLAQLRDGSLIVGDDTSGTLWRISYGD